MTAVAGHAGPSWEVLGRAGVESAARRAGGCSRPVRLVGSTMVVNRTTGEIARSYSSDDELDGTTYVKCGNRRAQVCPTCSAEYKGDAWHLLLCGLAGGKGIPDDGGRASVHVRHVHRPLVRAGARGPAEGPCRARRDKPVCPHGRPLWCSQAAPATTTRGSGEPLCADCYDYTAHVVWQWHAPELWRRFTIALQRELARRCGLTVKRVPGAAARSPTPRSWSSRPAA